MRGIKLVKVTWLQIKRGIQKLTSKIGSLKSLSLEMAILNLDMGKTSLNSPIIYIWYTVLGIHICG